MADEMIWLSRFFEPKRHKRKLRLGSMAFGQEPLSLPQGADHKTKLDGSVDYGCMLYKVSPSRAVWNEQK